MFVTYKELEEVRENVDEAMQIRINEEIDDMYKEEELNV